MPLVRRAPVIALSLALALVAAACSGDAEDRARPKALARVVPDDDIAGAEGRVLEVAVIVPDHSALMETGDVPQLLPAHYVDRWRAEAAAHDERSGGAEWTVRFQSIDWDPIAGPGPVCDAIEASGADLFMAAVRLPTTIHDCLAEDPRVSLTLTAGTGPRSFSILPRPAAFGRAAVAQLAELGLIEGPVAIVVGDDQPGRQTVAGVDRGLPTPPGPVIPVTVPTSQGVQAVRDRVPGVLAALTDIGARTVLVAVNTTVVGELGPPLVNGPWRTVGIDTAGLTDHWASGRLPEDWRGVPTVSALVPTTIDESAFEGECRTAFERFVAGETTRPPRAEWLVSVGRGVASTRGATDGDESLPPDIGYHECTLFRAFTAALDTMTEDFATDDLVAALGSVMDQPIARGRRGGFTNAPALIHDTLVVGLQPPDQPGCAPAGHQCWGTPSNDRSEMRPM